jgi:hypothetical protein
LGTGKIRKQGGGKSSPTKKGGNIMGNHAYWVKYKMYRHSEENGIDVLAKNKQDAYYKAIDKIEEKEGCTPYSAWVYSTTYQNGRHQVFKGTHEQNPF